MGSFWGTLGGIAQQTLAGGAAGDKNPLENAIIARYKRNPDIGTGGFDPSTVDTSNPVPMPTLQPPRIGQNPEQPMPQAGNQEQWNQPQQQSGGGGALSALASMALMKGGGIVTQPTIAKIGEAGPEAVVPLTPRPNNKLQPDLMEGHITGPKVPGVRYSRYKSFNRFGRGSAA